MWWGSFLLIGGGVEALRLSDRSVRVPPGQIASVALPVLGGRLAGSSDTLDAVDRRYLIRTFGCQMNEHDSERIGGLLMADGMTPTDDVDEARVIVLNTCAIRENADNKLYGNLGHLKPVKDRQPRPEDRRRRLPRAEGSGADPAEGPVGRRGRRHPRAAAPARPAEASRRPTGRRWTCASTRRRSRARCPPRADDAFRAWVSIAPGCDNACTFCIVPLVRGPQRSRSIGDILAEVQGLAARGVVEVTLLGQNVNTYGRDMTVPGLVAARRCSPAAAGGRTRSTGIRRDPVHEPAPARLHARRDRGDGGDAEGVRAHPLPAAIGLRRVLKAMRRSYRRERYLGVARPDPRRDPGDRRLDRHHRRVPR